MLFLQRAVFVTSILLFGNAAYGWTTPASVLTKFYDQHSDLTTMDTTTELSCTFEYGTCSFFQSHDDNFDWTRNSGSTPSYGTGPSGDHTTGTGYYMYIEATNAAVNSKARLISSPQDATDDQGLCLVFYFHMYGSTINTLNVYLSSGGNEELIFTRSQNQGNMWWRATVQFQSSSTWQIIFEGKRGTSYTSDIAIDDISILPWGCPTSGSTADWHTTPPADFPTTTLPFGSGCHCNNWCVQYNECCSYCQDYYTTPSEITTMDATTELYDQHSEVYLLLCEGQKKTIACPSNAIIEIVSASYGYNGSSTSAREECDPRAWYWELGDDNTRCHEQRSGDILKTNCRESSECEVFASSEVFGDPCLGTRKFLEVFYYCRAAGFPTTTLPFRSAYGWTTPASVLTNSGTIRLVGGSSQYEGRVEVFYNGQWGTVCDDSWHDLDAVVVCRQLGYSGAAFAFSYAEFGQGSGPIWLDDVSCTGNENLLQECRSNGWGSHNCNHYEDAGVQCLVSEITTMDATTEITTMDATTEFYDQHSEVYLLLCEGQKKAIACPSNAIIEIVFASYGYNGSSTSAREECDPLAWYWERGDDNTRCHEQSTGDILTTNCGGSSECEVFASSEVFGDPCWGIRKFLEVFYYCRADWHTTPPAGFPTTTLPFRSELSCTFEYDTCSFFQSYDDDFDWTRRQGSTPSSFTGPFGDHTTGTGYYMYIEASGKAANSTARLVSSPQDATDDQELCLVFFYHMYGDTINTLNVYLSSGGQEERIFSRSQNHGNIWWRTTTQFKSSSIWQIIFEGKIGTSFTGDIAIDDISILPWGCSTSGVSDWHTTPPADFLTTTSPFGSELDCTFEYGTCRYYQTVGDDFDWTRRQGSTPSRGTGPSGDHTTETGYYMYIEATDKAENSTARLISLPQDATDDQGLCLSFFYHMNGATINTLNVYLFSGGNEELIFTKSQNQGNNWWQATVQFQSSSTWWIIFEGRRGTDFTGDIAIDDISIFPGSCPLEDLPTTPPGCHCDSWCFLYNQCCSYCQELDCTFDYGTCRYYQMTGDDFDWTRHQGSTPSSNTGPSGDHTTGTGYYMYIEATNKAASSKARLISPPQDATNDQGLCLSFFYHMNGATINTLNVYLSSGGNEELIFTRSQNQGDNWWQATVQFQSSSTWRIIFEGRRGTDFTGDIAIDDISISLGSCPSEDLPATTSADLFLTDLITIAYSNPLNEVVFVDSVYNFASPNFPGNYPNHLSAKWVFSTFEGFQLLLKFRVLVTEDIWDRVRVGSGNTTDRLSYALYWSGGQPESDVQFLSSDNTLWVTFDTDFSVTRSGFAASVEAVKMSLSDLVCDDFNCANDGVCIPNSNVCDYVKNCGSGNDEEHCPGWNTEQPVWNTELPEPSTFDEISLHCGPTSFQVDIPMQLLPDDMQPNDFYFSKDPFDPSCRGFQNGHDYFSLNSSLTGCGTVYVENQTMSSYLNWVVYTRNASSVVEYQSDNLPVTCDFDRSKHLQSLFVITDESGQRMKRAKGSLLYDFSMYTDMNFDTRYDSYPVETTLNRNLYFRAELLRSPNNLRIHLRGCRATPSQNFDDVVFHELIHDGCGINNANVRVLTPSKPAQADFEIRSFRFRPDWSNHTSQVWIHCEVVVCDVNDPNSECLYDCERSRRRRSVAESSKEAKQLTQGPILFTDIEHLDQKSGSFISMKEHGEVNIFTVALTAVSLVMFLSLLVVGGALFQIMRREKSMEYRSLQNERYTTL